MIPIRGRPDPASSIVLRDQASSRIIGVLKSSGAVEGRDGTGDIFVNHAVPLRVPSERLAELLRVGVVDRIGCHEHFYHTLEVARRDLRTCELVVEEQRFDSRPVPLAPKSCAVSGNIRWLARGLRANHLGYVSLGLAGQLVDINDGCCGLASLVAVADR